MNDPFDILDNELVRAAARTQGRSAPRRLYWPRRTSHGRLLIAAVLMIGCGAAAAAVISGEHSEPLAGRVPPGVSKTSGPFQITGHRYTISFTPEIQAGATGWCSTMVIQGQPGVVSGCGGIAQTGSPTVDAQALGRWEELIVSSQVAAVRLPGGPTFLTRSDPGLPSGYRSAIFVEPRRFPPGVGAYTLLNSAGQPVTDGEAPVVQAPTRAWSGPHPAARGACSLKAGNRLRADGGSVVATIVPDPAVVGSAFLSCITTDYRVRDSGGGGVQVAVLLSAKDPGGPVAALPGMEAVAGQPGTLNRPSSFAHRPGGAVGLGPRSTEPGNGFAESRVLIVSGGFTARRVGNAWLIVAGGTGTQQRVEVLNQLKLGPIDLHQPRKPPAAPHGAKCSITFRRLATLTEVSQSTQGSARFAPPVCIQASFYYHDLPMIAQVASHTAFHPAPAQLHAVTGQPGVFLDEQDPRTLTTWRKFGHAWLAVRGGTKADQLALIEDITLHASS